MQQLDFNLLAALLLSGEDMLFTAGEVDGKKHPFFKAGFLIPYPKRDYCLCPCGCRNLLELIRIPGTVGNKPTYQAYCETEGLLGVDSDDMIAWKIDKVKLREFLAKILTCKGGVKSAGNGLYFLGTSKENFASFKRKFYFLENLASFSLEAFPDDVTTVLLVAGVKPIKLEKKIMSRTFLAKEVISIDNGKLILEREFMEKQLRAETEERRQEKEVKKAAKKHAPSELVNWIKIIMREHLQRAKYAYHKTNADGEWIGELQKRPSCQFLADQIKERGGPDVNQSTINLAIKKSCGEDKKTKNPVVIELLKEKRLSNE